MELKAWNIIVNTHKQHYYALETGYKLPTVQNDWEQFFGDYSVFGGYSKLFGEIDSQRHIQIGHNQAIPDIVIKDSSTQEDLFVVELKRYCISQDPESETQLTSYIRQLSLHVGLFICQDLYLYYVEGQKVFKTKIPFEIDNKYGVDIVKLLRKGAFDESRIKQFIIEKEREEENIRQIRKELQSLTPKVLVEKYFQDKYTLDEINQAVKDISFEIHVNLKRESTERLGNNDSTQLHGKIYIPTISNTFEEPTFKYVIIKIHEETIHSRGSIYEAVRYAWNVSLQKISNYRYVFAAVKGIVKGVFIVNSWQYDTHGRPNRVEFIGTPAPTSLENQFLNKMLPAQYRKPGQASPVLFSKN